MSRIMKQTARDNWIPNDKVELLRSLPPGVLCEKKKLLFLFETFSCIFCYLQAKIFLYTLFPLLYFPHVILKSCQFYCLLNSVLLFIFILMLQFKLLLLFVLIFFLINLFIIYGCVGSSFPCEGFLQLRQAGATLNRGAWASHCRGLSCCGAQAPDAQAQ